MKYLLLFLLAGLLSACNVAAPLEEVAKQETVTVYACGGWNEPQITQIRGAIDDINLNMRYRNTKQFLHYGGERSGLYGSGENDEFRCIYWIHDNYSTEQGQELWDGARDGSGDDFLAGEYDGSNVFIYGNGACPPGTSCTWIMQPVVVHELGHAFGAKHLSGVHAVMTSPVSSGHVTPADVEEYCRHVDCDPTYHAPAAKLAEVAQVAPANFTCLDE